MIRQFEKEYFNRIILKFVHTSIKKQPVDLQFASSCKRGHLLSQVDISQDLCKPITSLQPKIIVSSSVDRALVELAIFKLGLELMVNSDLILQNV